MIYLGLDPGVSGGLACVDGLGRGEARAMPTTERDILDALEALAGGPARGACIAVIERVHSMPKQGHSGAFTFGRSRGRLEMALTALRIPFEEVSPQVWQRAMGCLTGGDKNISKRRAQQLFPSLTIVHATADALLLAAFCRRQGVTDEAVLVASGSARVSGLSASAGAVPLTAARVRRAGARGTGA